MKQAAISVLLTLVFFSCTKNLTDRNFPTKGAANVPPATLFTNAVRTLSDNLAQANVNFNVWRFTVKHWAMTTYQEEAQYDFFTRGINQRWWDILYRDVLIDLKDASQKVESDAFLDAKIKQNQMAILDIIQVYAFSILVNTFGDVPYSGALDISNSLAPAYDDGATIYQDLLNRLATDIDNLDVSSEGFASDADVIYKGDIEKWVKFGNTLRFKLGMILADVDPTTAKLHTEAADAGAFSGAEDNAMVTYYEGPPNTNPLYTDIVLGGRNDYVAAKDLMDELIRLDDPRKTQFFNPNNKGEYVGGVVGSNNAFANIARPGPRVYDATRPSVLLDYTELEFFRAEAKERGFDVSGTAATHYGNGIQSSVLFWGGTEAQAAAYLAQPVVAYATASGGWKQKIGFQKWIALYNRPYDGWTELRRFDFPELTPPVGAISGFPNRHIYPANEQLINNANYTSAAAKIGGDEVETKLFWDKN